MSVGDRFKDKVAIITGGCSGIGRACSDVLANHGGKVVVLDINDDACAELNKENMHYIQCDMANEDTIKNAIEEVGRKYGRIDCLVNNVGIFPGTNSIDEYTVEGFKHLLNINLVSYFTASKYALPHLRRTKGSIVNIASVGGHIGTVNLSTYCASKGGVVALTKALAIDEAKHGVRVNAISPGAVNTPMIRNFLVESGNAEEAKKTTESFCLLNRMSEPGEIAMACLFLATDATFTTGEELMCTGGAEIGFGVKPLNV